MWNFQFVLFFSSTVRRFFQWRNAIDWETSGLIEKCQVSSFVFDWKINDVLQFSIVWLVHDYSVFELSFNTLSNKSNRFIESIDWICWFGIFWSTSHRFERIDRSRHVAVKWFFKKKRKFSFLSIDPIWFSRTLKSDLASLINRETNYQTILKEKSERIRQLEKQILDFAQSNTKCEEFRWKK